MFRLSFFLFFLFLSFSLFLFGIANQLIGTTTTTTTIYNKYVFSNINIDVYLSGSDREVYRYKGMRYTVYTNAYLAYSWRNIVDVYLSILPNLSYIHRNKGEKDIM